MMKIEATPDAHGVKFCNNRRCRYVPTSMIGTCVETRALREIVHGNAMPHVLATSNVRAPGDWPRDMRANDRAVLGL